MYSGAETLTGVLYLFFYSFKNTAVPLEIIEGFLHQSVQIHLVAELQLRVSLQHDGHHHQQLAAKSRHKRTHCIHLFVTVYIWYFVGVVSRRTSTMSCLYSGRTRFFRVSSTSSEKFISYMVMSDSVGCCTGTFRDRQWSMSC